MKLISEEVSSAEYLVEEDKNGKKEYKIKGVFLQSNIKNRNGRVYPKEILMKEVKRYNKDYINEKNVVTGISYSKNNAKVSIVGVVDKPGVAADVFEPIGKNNINIDMVIQNTSLDGKKANITFTIKQEDLDKINENKLEILDRPDFLSKLTQNIDTIGVAGSHGKTSTSALLSHIYSYNKIDYSHIYGGITPFSGLGGHYGSADKLILERRNL